MISYDTAPDIVRRLAMIFLDETAIVRERGKPSRLRLSSDELFELGKLARISGKHLVEAAQFLVSHYREQVMVEDSSGLQGSIEAEAAAAAREASSGWERCANELSMLEEHSQHMAGVRRLTFHERRVLDELAHQLFKELISQGLSEESARAQADAQRDTWGHLLRRP
jgi:hypothetical protein